MSSKWGRPLEIVGHCNLDYDWGVHLCLGTEVTTPVGQYDVTVLTNRNLSDVVSGEHENGSQATENGK